MTKEKIVSDCQKFFDYLEANGHKVIASTIQFSDGDSFSFGDKEQVRLMTVVVAADLAGYRVIKK